MAVSRPHHLINFLCSYCLSHLYVFAVLIQKMLTWSTWLFDKQRILESDQNGDIFSFLFPASSPMSQKKKKRHTCFVIVCTFGNRVSTSDLKQVLVHGIGLCVVLWMQFEQPCSAFFWHCFVSKQVTSVTVLFVDMQSGPKECGKATREDFLSSLKLVKVKLASGEKYEIICI